MKKKEFIKETHEYIDNCFQSFEQYQLIIQEIFLVFHNICKKHKITYYLAFGTLLGRVRDGGQIPWDYDCDVCVPIDQILELVKILNKELPKDYYFDSNITNSKYNIYMMRIGKKGYNLTHLHLDIFYLFGAPNNDKELKKFQKKIIKLFDAKLRLYSDIKVDGNQLKTFRKIVNYMKGRILAFPYNKLILDYYFNKYSKQYSIKESKNYIVCGNHAEYFPAYVFGTSTLYSDSIGEYYGPENPKKFLEIRYGNYGQYLPISERFDEFYFFYKLLEQ